MVIKAGKLELTTQDTVNLTEKQSQIEARNKIEFQLHVSVKENKGSCLKHPSNSKIKNEQNLHGYQMGLWGI